MPKNANYQEFDQEIQTGHDFVSLHLSLANQKNQSQVSDIRAALASLVEESVYLREVLASYGPYRFADALLFLASRQLQSSLRADNDGNGELVRQPIDMQIQQMAGMSYGFGS